MTMSAYARIGSLMVCLDDLWVRDLAGAGFETKVGTVAGTD